VKENAVYELRMLSFPVFISGLILFSLPFRVTAGARFTPRAAAFFGNKKPIPSNMAKLESPSAERNKELIWKVLESKVLPEYTRLGSESSPLQILEIATGSGVHTHHFSLRLHSSLLGSQQSFRWYPTDLDENHRASTQAYVEEESAVRDSVETPVQLTLDENGIMEKATDDNFKAETMDWIININMIHISPWEATLGLMKVAGQKLKSGGTLFLYGPYRVGGSCVESNLYVYGG
jgi:hypothetical protein